MKTEELSIFHGDLIWKGSMEYHNEHTFLHGFPYYQITEVDEVYYLWALDLDNADSRSYKIIKEGDDFSSFHDEGMKLDDKIREKYRAMSLHRLNGKELIEKLRSTD